MIRMSDPIRLVVGISGASGVRLLEALKPLPVATHLVMTRTAALVTSVHETNLKVAAGRRLADVSNRAQPNSFEAKPECQIFVQ